MSNEYEPNDACGCPRCVANRLMGAAVLVTLGVLFLVSKFTFYGFLWPVLLIVIGVVLLAQRNAPIDGHVQRSETAAAGRIPAAGNEANHG
jgi:hypothetical protein